MQNRENLKVEHLVLESDVSSNVSSNFHGAWFRA